MNRGQKHSPEQVVNWLRQIAVAITNRMTTSGFRFTVQRFMLWPNSQPSAWKPEDDSSAKPEIVLHIGASVWKLRSEPVGLQQANGKMF